MSADLAIRSTAGTAPIDFDSATKGGQIADALTSGRHFPRVFVTAAPDGDTCLFERVPDDDSRDPVFRRLELRRNRVCYMHQIEMSFLEWIVPVELLDWIQGVDDAPR